MKMKTIDEWIKECQARGHDVAVVILDRTTGEAIQTTLNPVSVGHLQHAEGATLISLKQLPKEV